MKIIKSVLLLVLFCGCSRIEQKIEERGNRKVTVITENITYTNLTMDAFGYILKDGKRYVFSGSYVVIDE